MKILYYFFVMITCMVLLCACMSMDTIKTVNKEIAIFPTPSDESAVYAVIGNDIIGEIDVASHYHTLDRGNIYGIDMNLPFMLTITPNMELVHISENGIKTLDYLNENSSITQYNVSENGSVVVCAYKNELIYYDVYADKRIVIHNLSDNGMSNYDCTLSPDGKYVLYTLRDESNNLLLFLWNNQTSICLGKFMYGLGISNSAKYIWVLGLDGLCLLNTNGEKTIILPDAYPYYTLNEDKTQILISTSYDIDECYFCDRLKTPVKVLDRVVDIFNMVIPEKSSNYSNTLLDRFYMIYGENEYDLIYIDKNGNSSKIDSDVTYAMLSASGDSIYYIIDDYKAAYIYNIRLDRNGIDLESKTLVGEMMGSRYIDKSKLERIIKVTPDGKGVYYVADCIDDTGTLLYWKDRVTTKIFDNVSEICINTDGKLLFMSKSSWNAQCDLYYLESNGHAAKIDYSVCDIVDSGKTIYYIKYHESIDGFVVYYSQNWNVFDVVLENIHIIH